MHVDAHLDVSESGMASETLAAIAACSDEGGLQAFRSSDLLPWGGGIHCGNYLYPCLHEGLVEHLIWVAPPHLIRGQSPLDWARGELQNWVDLTRQKYQSLHLIEGRADGLLKGRSFTLCTADRLPPLPEDGVLLDIDVNYYLYDYDRVWQTPIESKHQLGPLGQLALTVAYSVNGSYTPLVHRYLGDVTLARKKALALEAGPNSEPYARAARLGAAYRLQAINAGTGPFLKTLPGSFPLARASPPGASRRGRPVHLPAGISPVQAARLRWSRKTVDPAPRWRTVAPAGALVRELHAGQGTGLPEEIGQGGRSAGISPGGGTREPSLSPLYGRAWRDQGALKKAARALRKSLRIAPERLSSLQVQLDLARVYAARGKPALAQAELTLVRSGDVTGLYAAKALLAEG